MARRRIQREVKIEMTPFLDSLMIMMSLICLVLIVMIIPIIRNPRQLSVLSFRDLELKMKMELPKPRYIDCRPDGAVVIPGDEALTIDELLQPGNAVEEMLDRVAANRDEAYIILMVRPDSLPVYRHLRREIARRQITIGTDVLEKNAVLSWRERLHELNISVSKY